MARQTITVLTDDIDGGKAQETVKFGLDGVAYEIDLSGKNALALRKAFEPYLDAGSKVGRGGVAVGGRVARSSSAANREENQLIRAWAKQAGKDISDRGRIPQEIVSEYRARSNGSAPAKKAAKKAGKKAA